MLLHHRHRLGSWRLQPRRDGPAAWVCLGLILALLSGCHSPRQPYPIGLYGVQTASDMALARKAGFNLIMAGPAEARFLKNAEEHGLKVLATPNTTAGFRFDSEAARRAVRSYDRSPVVWGWYLCDEPDVHNLPPDKVLSAHRFLKSIGAAKPTSIVLYQTSRFRDYAGLTDVLIADSYPVPWLPVAKFRSGLYEARLAQGGDKPVLAVIQAFDWGAFPKESPVRGPTRPPTREELRCMVYSALTAEVSGISFFCFNTTSWRLPDHPEIWQAVQDLAAEIRRFEPLFQGKRVWWPMRNDYPIQGTDMNEASDGAVVSVCFRVRDGNAQVAPGLYVVCVNTSDRALDFRIQLPATVQSEAAVLGEQRKLPLKELWVKDQFAAHGVHVYGPIKEF